MVEDNKLEEEGDGGSMDDVLRPRQGGRAGSGCVDDDETLCTDLAPEPKVLAEATDLSSRVTKRWKVRSKLIRSFSTALRQHGLITFR